MLVLRTARVTSNLYANMCVLVLTAQKPHNFKWQIAYAFVFGYATFVGSFIQLFRVFVFALVVLYRSPLFTVRIFVHMLHMLARACIQKTCVDLRQTIWGHAVQIISQLR